MFLSFSSASSVPDSPRPTQHYHRQLGTLRRGTRPPTSPQSLVPSSLDFRQTTVVLSSRPLRAVPNHPTDFDDPHNDIRHATALPNTLLQLSAMLFLLPLLATLVPSVAAYGKGFTNTKVVSAYFPSYQMAPAVRSVAFLFASVFLTPSSPSGRSLRSIHTPRLLRLHHYPGRALFPPFFSIPSSTYPFLDVAGQRHLPSRH